MAQPQQGYTPSNESRTFKGSIGKNSETRAIAVVVLAALALLILIRLGFRGVNVFGVSASVN